ncbi:MAG TPA: hypothetical protein VHU19_06795 [Pyrinomonadaceae bacterium]|nr:hypothetical protein [Pyrinomonadaceae bacterium]
MRAFILSAALLSAALPLTSAAASASAPRQDEERRFLDPKLVPAAGSAAKDFVPRGWKIEGDEGETTGDLNKDGVPDKVLRLVEDIALEGKDGTYNTRYRALVILFGQTGDGFKRAAVATKLLSCTLCAGALGDPEGGNIQVEIKNGVLNVNQLSGSREATDLTQRFRYDPASTRFLLIGQDVNEYDRLEGGGTSESTNYLTGLRVTKKTKATREGLDPSVVSNQTTRVPVQHRFIEDVDYEKSFGEEH